MTSRNVDVYRYDQSRPVELLYHTPALYLNGDRSRFKMEFPLVPYLADPDPSKDTASRGSTQSAEQIDG